MTTYRAPTETDRRDPEYLRSVYTTKRDLALLRAKHLTGAKRDEYTAKAARWQAEIDSL
jgi:hypothetical protein